MLQILILTWLLARAGDADEHFQAGRYEEAAAAYEMELAAEPDDARAWYRLGFSLHQLGRLEDALAAHERGAALPGPTRSGAAYNAACAAALLGREDAADRLGRAVELGFANPFQIESDADLDAVRGTPAFRRAFAAALDAGPLAGRRPTPDGNGDQFDFWLGDWDVDVWSPDANGGWSASGALTVQVDEVADGAALVEWSEGTIGGGPTLGFSLRAFDPETGRWTRLLNWPQPGRPSFYSLWGGFRHGRGEFFTLRRPNGDQTRFTFSDVAADRLRWDGARTLDGGKTWTTNLLFELRRRPADAPPLANGPSRANGHGSDDVFRDLDFLLGDWSGVRAYADGSSETLAVTATSVLEGSAIAVRRARGDAPEVRHDFAILAFEPARRAWVRYAVRSGDPRFERQEGTIDDGAVELRSVGGPGASAPARDLRFVPVEADGAITVSVTCGRPGSGREWTETWTRR